jgi:hypothetical protein
MVQPGGIGSIRKKIILKIPFCSLSTVIVCNRGYGNHFLFWLLSLIKQSKYLFKARSNVWRHLQKAYPKLIVFHPSHDGLLDRQGLRLVGKPELQPQTRPTGEGWRTFDPTSM